MRTNIVIDEKLLKTAFRYTNVKTKKQLIELTLKEFIENHQRRDIREIQNQICLDPNYDYKKSREDS